MFNGAHGVIALINWAWVSADMEKKFQKTLDKNCHSSGAKPASKVKVVPLEAPQHKTFFHPSLCLQGSPGVLFFCCMIYASVGNRPMCCQQACKTNAAPADRAADYRIAENPLPFATCASRCGASWPWPLATAPP